MKGELDRKTGRPERGTWDGNIGQLSFLVGADRIVTDTQAVLQHSEPSLWRGTSASPFRLSFSPVLRPSLLFRGLSLVSLSLSFRPLRPRTLKQNERGCMARSQG